MGERLLDNDAVVAVLMAEREALKDMYEKDSEQYRGALAVLHNLEYAFLRVQCSN